MFNKKTISRIKLIGLLAFVTVASIFALLANKIFVQDSAVVTYDGHSFIPPEVVIKKGGKVVFKNLSDKNFWPASDFHPINSIYPEFDPRRPIQPNETWEFTFDKSGEFGYHDHLSAFNRAKITVREGGISKVDKNCGDLRGNDYQERELCWYRQIKKEIDKNGVDGALALFKKIYEKEPLFGQGCHDVMHLIGDEAYRQYRSGVEFTPTRETKYCGYGFYHGFIEAMLYTTGNYEEVKAFCDSLKDGLSGEVESSNAMYSCYHGIGHSTFDIHDSSLWGDEKKMVIPAIETCEKVTKGLEEEKTKQCVTGVFNALGNAYSNNQYYLKMNQDDPVWICRGLKPNYKRVCFIDVSFAWIALNFGGGITYNFEDAAKFIAGLNDPPGESAAMISIASEYARLNISIFDTNKAINICSKVKNSLFDSCIKGLVEGLLGSGRPDEEYKEVLKLCSSELLDDGKKQLCYSHFLPFLPTIYSKEKRVQICERDIPPDYQVYCNQ